MTRKHCRHTLITSMRDEGPFILEWVAHHKAVGFDRIVIGFNDCRDGSEALLSALARHGVIEAIENHVPEGQIPQHAAYERMRRDLGIDNTDWLMVLDADEFLNVQIAGHGVADLTAAAEGADIIALHAMGFTSTPEVNWQPGPICPRFPWRLKLTHAANRALKTMTRAPGRFQAVHNHSVAGFRGKLGELRVLWGDGVLRAIDPGLPLWKQLRNTAVTQDDFQLAFYNHYAVKTWDAFNLRRARGRGAVALGAGENDRHTEEYFNLRNQPEARDETILRHKPTVSRLMSDLLALPGVAKAQSDCDRIFAELASPWRRDTGAE